MSRRVAPALVAVVAVSACVDRGAEPRADGSAVVTLTATPVPSPSPTPTPTPRDCTRSTDALVPGGITQLGDDPVATSLAVSATWSCAEAVVVAPAAHPDLATMAAPLAGALRGPLLLAPTAGIDGTVRDEIRRLAPHRLVLVGPATALPVERRSVAADTTIERIPVRRAAALAPAVAARAPGAGPVLVRATNPEDLPAAVTVAVRTGAPLFITGPTLSPAARQRATTDGTATFVIGTGTSPPAWFDALDAAGVRVRFLGAPDAVALYERVAALDAESPVVLVAPDDPARPALLAADVATLEAPAGDPRAGGPAARAIRGRGRVALTGAVPADRAWQLRVAQRGLQLPGGGQLIRADRRRYVALYGKPGTGALGVLGEQGAEAAADRLAQVVRGYDGDGREVVGAFELIATTASGSAGPDGDYSAELPVDVLQPWVDVARERGLYVLLDLQPGRTDFLTQAKRYEPLLRQPHVGLALDPEWRLGPGQRHLAQIGSVAGSEVDAVADWLAGLVREHALPQKMLLLHQFRLSMLRDRDTIRTDRPELTTVIQMDGQGPLATKYATYRTVTRDFVDRVAWGWKNFYDEDSPMANPDQVLALDPPAVFVSFQ